MRGPLLLTRALASLMAMQPLIGLLLWEHYRDPEPLRTTWFGNDLVTLILAVPLLLLGLVRGARGSTRGLLLWLGMIAHRAGPDGGRRPALATAVSGLCD